MTAKEKEIRFDWVYMRLGRWMRQQRKEHGWTQEKFAEMLGVHRNTLCCWERADTSDKGVQPPRITDFVLCCDLFERDPGRALMDVIREPRTTVPDQRRRNLRAENEPTLAELVAEREGFPKIPPAGIEDRMMQLIEPRRRYFS